MRKQTQTPADLASEGRNLVTAYFTAYEGWRRESDAIRAADARDEPYEVMAEHDRRGGDVCMVACVCQEALLAFVVRASGRKLLEPPGDSIEMDLWPAAAVELDGRLWVAYQGPNSEAGELQLCHLIMADVFRLPGKDGAR